MEHQEQLIRKKIKDIVQKATRGAIMRSRATYETLGERPSKYFLNLEKRNFSKKTIYRLQLKSGVVISDPECILREQRKFYDKLYTSAGPIDENYVKNLQTPQISEEDKIYLDLPISQEEKEAAIKVLPGNKFPGTDGLSADFYKIFYPKMKDLLFEVYKEVVVDGKFHLSARRGIISLLEKAQKKQLTTHLLETTYLTQYRPEGLLKNTCYEAAESAR